MNSGRTLTSTGPLHLAVDARLHANSATGLLQNNTTQLDTGSEINGGVAQWRNRERPGPGRQAFNLFGTNTFNATIDVDQTTIISNGAATLNGSGSLVGDGCC